MKARYLRSSRDSCSDCEVVGDLVPRYGMGTPALGGDVAMGSILDAFDSVSLTHCLSFTSLLVYNTIQHERVTGHRLRAQREVGIGIELLRQIVLTGWGFSDVPDGRLRDTAEYLTSMYLNPPCFRAVSVDMIVCAIVQITQKGRQQ